MGEAEAREEEKKEEEEVAGESEYLHMRKRRTRPLGCADVRSIEWQSRSWQVPQFGEQTSSAEGEGWGQIDSGWEGWAHRCVFRFHPLDRQLTADTGLVLVYVMLDRKRQAEAENLSVSW